VSSDDATAKTIAHVRRVFFGGAASYRPISANLCNFFATYLFYFILLQHLPYFISKLLCASSAWLGFVLNLLTWAKNFLQKHAIGVRIGLCDTSLFSRPVWTVSCLKLCIFISMSASFNSLLPPICNLCYLLRLLCVANGRPYELIEHKLYWHCKRYASHSSVYSHVVTKNAPKRLKTALSKIILCMFAI